MNQRIDAIFENGVFRPELPVNIPDGERVSLQVESRYVVDDDLRDVEHLLDIEYIEDCRRRVRPAGGPSLAGVRAILSKYQGSLADDISAERDDR
jgi:predicted DNA-binding antitoxin AbrB/MazE fold protein